MSTPRTRLSAEQRRAQIVAVGVEALADRSFDELSVEWIAERSGVSRGLIFHYFGSLSGLHHAIIVTARDALLASTDGTTSLEPYTRLRVTLARLVDFVEAHPRTFYALVRGGASANADARAALDEAREALTERVVAGFDELGFESGPAMRRVVRAWVAFAEECLAGAAISPEAIHSTRLVSLLERSALAVAAVAAEDAAPEA